MTTTWIAAHRTAVINPHEGFVDDAGARAIADAVDLNFLAC
ncbi:hypothetical protein [Streptomyces sp. MMG1121]|nr:hypothetical protein [Streptomyces sp. MMG1121]